jgi:hypothetical protein
MGLMDILNQYVGQQGGQAAPAAVEHFGQVAQQVPQSTVSQGLTEAFRSDQTPPFGEMVGRLFGNSNPEQRAGLLTQLISGLGAGSATAGVGNAGPLGDLVRQLGGGGTPVTPEQAAAVTPEQVQQAATHAEQQNPGIVERVSDFYAQHSTLVQTLGSAALAIALAKMAQR